VRAGYDVHWIAADDNRETSGTDDHRSAVTLHRLPRRALAARLIRSAGLVRQASELAAALYHIHDPELLPAAMSIRRRTGARIVYDKHEYQRGRRGAKAAVISAVERVFAPRVDGVVVVECAESSPGAVQEPDECVRPDYDGLNLEGVEVAWLPNYPRSAESVQAVRPMGALLPDQPIRLVYTGVLARERGLWSMLDLVEKLKRRGRSVELSLVGICHRESERSQFEADLRSRGLEHDIRLVGWTQGVPWQDLMHEAARADVGLMLMDMRYRSWSNIPTKFYEYMSLGLPFVCTAYPAWMDFVVRWGCGVVVDPRNPSEVADTVLEIVASPGTYAEYSANGKQASTRFSWQAVEGRLIDLYRRLGVG
jgi:glycosyltransferase involved in cell wall biosynthesis